MTDVDIAKVRELAAAAVKDAEALRGPAETTALETVDVKARIDVLAEAPLKELSVRLAALVGNANAAALQAQASAVAVVTHAKLIADLAAALGADEPPPDNGEPEPDLIGEWSNVTGVTDLPAGALKGARLITLLAEFTAVAGKYEKLVGAGSSANTAGGLCIGRTPSGAIECWVQADGMKQALIGKAPAGRPIFVAFAIGADTADAMWAAQPGDAVTHQAIVMPREPDPFDGPAALLAGYWNGARVDPTVGVLYHLRAYRTYSPETVQADLAAWGDVLEEDPIDPPPPPPPPDDGALEKVDSSVTQVSLKVDATSKQTWIGYGWGVGSRNNANGMLDLYKRYQAQAFDELDARLVRLIDPHAADFVSVYKPMTDFFRTKGVDTFIGSGFYKSGGYSISSLADGVHTAIQAGIPITHVIPQNEPDGGTKPFTPDGELASMFRTLRNRLNDLGHSNVKVIGQEWAHGGGGDAKHEFDLLDAAGLVPGVVAHGSGHLYGDCFGPEEFDDRWWKRLAGILSMETGYMNGNTAPRVISGMNNGSIGEVSHQCISKTSGDTDLRQKLITNSGERRPPQYQMQLVSKAVPRGSVARAVTWEGQSTRFNARMVRRASSRPIVAATCWKRPDGTFALIVCSATDATSGAKRFQATVDVAELASKSGTWSGRKCTSGGSISSAAAVMVAGRLRFTVGSGETWALIGGA